MAEQEAQDEQLPLDTVGQRLRRAREAAGLSVADISERTKIAKRHLLAIEEDRFADLAGRTYAVGFARAYARAVGMNEAAIADAVRDQLAAEDEHWPAPKPDGFEPGDPARVPPAGLAWMAGLGALAVILLLFVFWRSYISPAGSLPGAAQDAPSRPSATAKAGGARKASPAARGGPVVFTALESGIWVRFYDATGNRLYEKQMTLGESYTVPANANGPMVKTARPDALRITIGGQPVPGLGKDAAVVSDIPVTAAALLARGKPQPQGDASTRQQPAQPRAASSSRPRATGIRTRSAVSASPAPRVTQPETSPGADLPITQPATQPSTVSN